MPPVLSSKNKPSRVQRHRISVLASPKPPGLGDDAMEDGLYPEIEPYETAMLERDGHKLYYELSGNSEGPTALFLHGGPGGGVENIRQFLQLRRVEASKKNTKTYLCHATFQDIRVEKRFFVFGALG